MHDLIYCFRMLRKAAFVYRCRRVWRSAWRAAAGARRLTSEEAIQIATLNGATFLGEDSRIGTLATGKQEEYSRYSQRSISVQGWCWLRSGKVDCVNPWFVGEK